MKINIFFDTGFGVEFFVEGILCFSSLMTKVKDLFPTLHDFNLQWKDEDGDMITFSSQEELDEAIFCQSKKLDIYVQGVQATTCIQNDHTHPPRCQKPKAFISPETLPDLFSVTNVTRKIKRCLRRCGRKRSLRHRIPAAECYPTNQKSRCRRHHKDISKGLAAICISENDP